MNPNPDQYNIAAIRNLIKDAFTAKELWRFCQDRSDFRPVMADFGFNPTLADMTDVLIEYCQTKLLLDELLAEIRAVNSRWYEQYEKLLRRSGELPALQIPHNLPPRSEFVGREVEKARAHKALCSRAYLISIEGIGGIGKTSLALEVAHECLQASQSGDPPAELVTFDSIVWSTGMDRPVPLNALLDAIALTLDYPGIVQLPLEQKRIEVEKLLRAKPCLLIVDGFTTTTDDGVQDFLRYLPEPSKALITTRKKNLGRMWAISLKGLEETEALELIRGEGQRLGLTSIQEANDERLLHLHTATGGAPLALKWAVGQIKQRGQSLDAMLAALHEARGSIFEYTFARSWDLLSPDAQRVLMVMPLFATQASRAAIEVASNMHDFALDTAMGQLVEMFLVDATDELESIHKRYSIHPLTRAFVSAKYRSEQDFAQAALERALQYYKQLVTPPKKIRKQIGELYWDGMFNYAGVHALWPEWGNISHFIHWALDPDGETTTPEWETPARRIHWPANLDPDAMALALFLPIVHLLNAWGLWDERLELSRKMCQVANRLGNRVEAWLWIDAIGYVLSERRKRGELEEALDRGRVIARRFNQTDALILADAFESWLYLPSRSRDIDRALQAIKSALKSIDLNSAFEYGPVRRIVLSRVARLRAYLYHLQGDFDNAPKWYRLALDLRCSVGEDPTPSLLHLAQFSLELDDISSAESYLARVPEIPRPKDSADLYYTRALVAERNGQVEQALGLAEDALDEHRRWGPQRERSRYERLVKRLRKKIAESSEQ